MFTVKASYRGETRKLSFTTDGFPSYERLSKELYRLFPIARGFYLSKLLFSPDAAQGGRILIGKEVHSAEDYRKTVAPYINRIWPHGLLRFSVHDDAPHKILNATSSYNEFTPHSNPGFCFPPMSSISLSHIPNSPVNHSVTSGSSSVIVNDGQLSAQTIPILADFISTDSSNSSQTVTQEVQKLIVDFKKDLDHILEMKLGSSVQTSSSSHLPFVDQQSASTLNAWNGFRCSRCRQVQYWCCSCRNTRCLSCVEPNFPECYSRIPPHRWVPISPQETPSQSSDAGSGDDLDPLQRSQTPRAPNPPFQTSETFFTKATDVTTPKALHASIPQGDGVSTQEPRVLRTSTVCHSSSDQIHQDNQRPVIHSGIICDVCEKTIAGVRHKCLDCPDYDLCTGCMESGSAERHDPFHEFYGIAEPGRVIVHAISQGNTIGKLSHYATCDLCDIHIVGDRYKCLQCPDFDTCSSCFRITDVQHPHHAFVRLRCQEDYIQRVRSQQVVHNAICNLCMNRIQGVRFKCMHPDCHDFDLCGACESHPIPLHPEAHPLLKIKTLDATIPAVSHVSRLNPTSCESKAQVGDNSASNGSHEYVDHTEHTQPFMWGHMRAPSPPSKHSPLTEAPLVPRLDQISPPFNEDTSSTTRSPHYKTPGDSSSLVEKLNHILGSPPPDPSVERAGSEPGSDLVQLLRSMSLETDAPLSFVVAQGMSSNGASTTNSTTGAVQVDEDPEPLANMEQISPQPVSLRRHALATLLNDYQSVSTNEATPSVSPPTLEETQSFAENTGQEKVHSDCILPRTERSEDLPEDGFQGEKLQDPVTERDALFRATFIEDVTVPDGQVFPPGAEFMKCWRLRNNSENDWPNSTSLVCAAGELLGFDMEHPVQVGLVHAGATVDIWTSELKAPNTPGRYVSYWRLRDNESRVFGDIIWIDIVVATRDDSDESILSSVVIMPHAPSIRASAPSSELSLPHAAPVSTPASLSIAADDDDSDSDSDISLVSIPTSEEDLIRDDIVSSLGDGHSQAGEYVVLYDDRSSEDE